jgi:hypothetical protein
MTGGVRSRLTATLAVAVFPARSVAVPVTSWLAPSVVTVTGADTEATPDKASVAAKLTVVSARLQPAALGAGVTVGVTSGGVLSRLSVTEALALFPATSAAVPEMI